MNTSDKIIIIGAGLVGTLWASMLGKLGFKVAVYEKRKDPRLEKDTEGKSINLAVSHRAWQALHHIDLVDEVKKEAIPMFGRKIHDTEGDIGFQSYSKDNKAIYSMSRKRLNELLLNKAETYHVNFYFEHQCQHVSDRSVTFSSPSHPTISISYDALFGADGAFSAVREYIEEQNTSKSTIDKLDHGYLEVDLLPSATQDWAFKPDGLHIWPRGGFMLIGLPNPDKTFTGTLFLPKDKLIDSNHLTTEQDWITFFQEYFPDTLPYIDKKFFTSSPQHRLSSLGTLNTSTWSYKNVLLLGDAAHAIVPFYGQGMNAGFESCRKLIQNLPSNISEWTNYFKRFSEHRKKDTDAIAQLALRNFLEMRDWVNDEVFLCVKKLDVICTTLFPDKWIPQYTQVTFTDIPYRQALQTGDLQNKKLRELVKKHGLNIIKKPVSELRPILASILD